MDRCRIISDENGVEIKIYGRDLEELFINAAYGLARVLYSQVDKTSRFIRGADKLKLKAEDRDSLLIDFLNKVLVFSNEEGKLYPRAKVLKISPKNLVVQISGVEIEEFDVNLEKISKASINEKDDKLEAFIKID